MGWSLFCKHKSPSFATVVRDFYANMMEMKEDEMRQRFIGSVAPLFGPTRLAGPKRIKDACLIPFFYFTFHLFIYLFIFKSVTTRIPGSTRRADLNRSLVYSDCFHLIY